MRSGIALLALAFALGLGACDRGPVAPELTAHPGGPVLQRTAPGTGLVLESLTGLPVLGDVEVAQVVITEFAVDALGGLQATGEITLIVNALGETVTEEFTTAVHVSSSGRGQCELARIDLAPITVDAIGGVSVDLPEAEVAAQGSGAIGSLLCMLGQIVEGLAPLSALTGILEALNKLI